MTTTAPDELPWPRIRRWPVAAALMLAASLVAGIVVFVVAVLVQWPPLTRADLSAQEHLVRWTATNLWVVDPARWLSVAGLGPVIVSGCVVVAVVEHRRGRTVIGVWLLATLLVGWSSTNLLKLLVDRPRPPTNGLLWDATTSSFPSGHASVAIYGYGALALVAWWSLTGRRRTWLTLGLLVLGWGIAASRLVLGVHWVSDVLVGYATGLAVLLVTTSWLASRTSRIPPGTHRAVAPKALPD